MNVQTMPKLLDCGNNRHSSRILRRCLGFAFALLFPSIILAQCPAGSVPLTAWDTQSTIRQFACINQNTGVVTDNGSIPVGTSSVFGPVQVVDSTLLSVDTMNVAVTGSVNDLLFLTIWSGRAAANTTFTVTDTLGNTWVQLDFSNDGGGASTADWYALPIKGGADTITVTAVHGAGGAASMESVFVEYSGITALDAHATGANTSVTVTTTAANDLAILSTGSSGVGAVTAVSPWRLRYAIGGADAVDEVVTLPGVVNGTNASSPNYANGNARFLVAFKTGIVLSPSQVPASIQIFTNKNLASDVAVTANTLTPIDSVVVVMPSSGGPWRAQVAYNYFLSGGVNGECTLSDGTTTWAQQQTQPLNNIGNCANTAWSKTTYANGQSVTFSVNVWDTGATTIKASSNFHTASASYIQVAVESSN